MSTTLLDANGNPPTIARGEHFTFEFAVVNPDGTAKNLTGASEVSFAIGFDRNAVSRDLLLELGDGVTHDDDGGNVTVVGTPAQSDDLPVGILWCELWITDITGRRDIVGSGRCIVHDSMVTVP